MYKSLVVLPFQRRRPALLGIPIAKLTGYRLIVIALTVGFGLSKTILSYKGKSIAPITLEWVFGVVIYLLMSQVSFC